MPSAGTIICVSTAMSLSFYLGADSLGLFTLLVNRHLLGFSPTWRWYAVTGSAAIRAYLTASPQWSSASVSTSSGRIGSLGREGRVRINPSHTSNIHSSGGETGRKSSALCTLTHPARRLLLA